MSTETTTTTAPGATDATFAAELSAREAAILLGVQFRTLASYRQRGTGPAYTKVGYRTVRYARADIEAYLAARRVVPKRRGESAGAEID